MLNLRNSKTLFGTLFFVFLFIASLAVTLNIHHNKGRFNWESEIWADKAGYYIYLPALFYFHFDIRKCPEKIDEKTGYGFSLDHQQHKIATKYTYGVALMVSPFFIATHVISRVFQIPEDFGFSLLYHKMIDLSAVVYLIMGLWFLKKFFSFYFEEVVQFVLLFIIYAGTNLFYYAVNETLMSHVYSFFLFALFLYLIKKFLSRGQQYHFFLLMSLVFGLIIVVRPLNVIILLLFFFWDTHSLKGIISRIRLFLGLKYLAPFLIIVLLVLVPQLLYWKYLHNSFVWYSYQGESFTNWNHPQLIKVWFSSLNGLFLYSPVVLFFVAGMILMAIKRIPNGILILCIFFLISWVFASWYNWYFGAAYGQRLYVDYYPLLGFPLGWLIQHVYRMKSLLKKIIIFSALVSFTGFNAAMAFSFNKSFFGSTWDWDEYARIIGKARIFPPFKKIHNVTNDFENQAVCYSYTITDSVCRSGNYCAVLIPDSVKYCVYESDLINFGRTGIDSIHVSFWGYKLKDTPVDVIVVCVLEKNQQILYSETKQFGSLLTEQHQWIKIKQTFFLPIHHDPEAKLRIFIRNHSKQNVFLDDLEIKF